ncbi:MAG: hypothetical protein HY290_00880 [Planctomycetia bacterium]|nr:hypothetical protein [Planctomycetia bacterium]
MMELICGACHGRLLVEVPGTTVACPHCGTHLQAPAATPGTAPQSLSLELEDDPEHAADSEGDTVNMHPGGQALHAVHGSGAVEPFGSAPSATAEPPGSGQAGPLVAATASSMAETVPEIPPGVFTGKMFAVAPAAHSAGPAEVDDPRTTISEAAMSQFARMGEEAGQGGDTPCGAATTLPESDFIGAFSRDVPVETFPGGPQFGGGKAGVAGAVELSPDANRREMATGGPAPNVVIRRGVSPITFMLVASYASAMTLACLFLLYLLKTKAGTLDLPDLELKVPADKKKVTSLIYLPPDKDIPPANVLRLGETRQYGSLRVTPLRVTRGPVEFQFYDPEADEKRDPEGPVLKLHLRFENVSEDQEFVPLDGRLVFTKEIDRRAYGSFKANNFVYAAANRKNTEGRVYAFDQTPGGMWLIKDQHIDQYLAPGQDLEAFIPTATDEINTLSGELVWRVHFRKGYNRKSFRGVTTLIEVLFNSSQITDDEPAPSEMPTDDQPEHPAAEPAGKDPSVKDA